MTRLVADLLDIARIEAGTLSVELAPCDLDELLERVEEAHAEAARRKRLAWQVESSGCSATLLADRDRLLQALGNLVGNAIKFTPEGGRVWLDARVDDGCVRMGVRDTGPGMDASQLAHVFDRFWQGRRGDRRGAGLGLAIARGIVEAHGGQVWMESEPGHGTTAWVELPRAERG
jgi:signal transduction histidine kinase